MENYTLGNIDTKFLNYQIAIIQNKFYKFKLHKAEKENSNLQREIEQLKSMIKRINKKSFRPNIHDIKNVFY